MSLFNLYILEFLKQKFFLQKSVYRASVREQSLFMTGTGAEEIWEGAWKKIGYLERGYEKLFHSREGS